MRKLKCFICGETWLGLKGQDTICDTVFSLSEPEDKHMLDVQAFGECHLQCLTNSSWGSYWNKRIFNNLVSIRQYPVIGDVNNIKVMRNEHIKTTFLLGKDGWIAELHDQHIVDRIAVEEGFQLPVNEELYIDLVERPEIAHEIRTTFLGGSPIAFLPLIDKLSLRNRLFYPQAIESGLLYPKHMEGLPATMIPVYAKYNEFISYNIMRFILRNIDIN